MVITNEIVLRPSRFEDLPKFFLFQLDTEANYLAAFTSKDLTNKAAYLEKHEKFLTDSTITQRTILVNNIIAGSIAKFEIEGDAEITYWIDRAFWGKGVATTALKKFLVIENTRPLFGRVAYDNYPSQKVLEKAGFIKIGKDKGFANSRQTEIEEFIYRLT